MEFFRCYDFTIENEGEYDEDLGMEYANYIFGENETSFQKIKHHNFVGSVNGVDVYYDFVGEYFFYDESTWFKYNDWEDFLMMSVKRKNEMLKECGLPEKEEDAYIDWEKEQECIRGISNPRFEREFRRIVNKEKKEKSLRETLGNRGRINGGGW
jgi:hypothetical protein